ncbi:hypothetical protein [Haliangium sp.]|uniref:hypothetical protein n=1 Tax=Haliangium sp. TaxID=2663208 RepID=UPI003D0E2B9A
MAAALGIGPVAMAQEEEAPPTPAPAPADTRERTIEVRVIEVAGQYAYIEPGEDAGLRPGQDITIKRKSYRVVTVSRLSAVIALGDGELDLGDAGSARVRVRNPDEPVLPPPAPLSEYEGQWGPGERPAAGQDPKPVPLGGGADSGRYRVLVRAGVSGLVSGGVSRVYGTLGAAMHAEPWQEVPFGVDADLAVAMWLGTGADSDRGANSRPPLRVRELTLRYGPRSRPYVGLGRLRYAATTLGLLDGVRLTSPAFNGARVAVFGGVVPDALDAMPDFDHRRFGVEATYHEPNLPWSPFLTVVAHGSLFDGELDERRLSGVATVYQGPLTVHGHAELSFFDEDNPWGVDPAELTAAGVDATVRWGNTRVGARFDMRQPERSLWLASFVPQSWLCTTTPLPPQAMPEPCGPGRDVRYSGAVDGQVEFGSLTVAAGGAAIGISNADGLEELNGYLDARLYEILGRYRAGLGVLVAQSSLFDTTAVRVSGGGPMPFLDGLDLSVFYRPALIVYQASVEDYLDHRVGVDVAYMPIPRLDVGVSVEAMFGDDVSGLGAFATALWRPAL